MNIMHPKHWFFLLIVVIAGLPGCLTTKPAMTEYPMPAPSLQPEETPSKILTAFPSGTNLPTATVTPTKLPAFTLTPLATLEPTQAQEALRQLLLKQEICQVPCFWGITPSQTTLDEAQNIFDQLNIHFSHMSQKNGKDFYATDFGFHNGLATAIVLTIQNGLVNSMETSIGLTNYKGSPALREWLAFSPETILSQNGTPSYVEFYLSTAPSDGSSPYTVSYSMILYFDSLNLIVEYSSPLVKDEKLIKVCPLVDKFDGVGVWLGKDANNMPTKVGVPLEQTTSLTREQFYNRLLGGSKKTACFDLSRSAFSP